MRIRTSLLIGSALAALATPALGQDPPETAQETGPTEQEAIAQAADQPPLAEGSGQEVVVTATKRATTVQDVPFSVNAQTEEDIQR